jgi:phospholipase/carboxylesterase
MQKRYFLVLLLFVAGICCICFIGYHRFGVDFIELCARPTKPTHKVAPGEHALGLGGWRLVNRDIIWRDGRLFIPTAAKTGEPLPLLIWLHGGGGESGDFVHNFSEAEKLGIVVLALDARHNTWDGIDSRIGPDVKFIDKALKYTFERVNIDPKHIALGGLSDGASYSLTIGRSNGNLFTHLIAFAPRLRKPRGPLVGKPLIFIGHGIKDNVYSVRLSQMYNVPMLIDAGYDVTYYEFDGPHWVPESAAREAMQWLIKH